MINDEQKMILYVVFGILVNGVIAAPNSMIYADDNVQNYLMRFGYLPQSDRETGNLRTDDQLRSAIKNLQSFGGVDVTGEIDEATKKLMNAPRCGVADRPDPRFAKTRHRRYTIHGQKWPYRNLTWSEIRGYVDHAPNPTEVGPAGKRLNVLKFVINNGAGKRVMCLAWENQIDRVKEIVAKNKILHIEGAQAKLITNQRFNLGNAIFELNIRKVTTIVELGMRVADEPQNNLPVVAWDDLTEKEGETVCVVGWVKFPFAESRHFNNESSYGFGSITDGLKKLEVRLASLADLPAGLTKGTEVKITGILNYGSYLYIKLESGANVIATGGKPFDPEAMLNITMPPTKRARIA